MHHTSHRPTVARLLTVVMATASLGGCAYGTVVAPSAAPAAEVMPKRVIATPTSIRYEGLEGLDRFVNTSVHACGFSEYRVEGAAALGHTLATVNRAAFSDIRPGIRGPGAYEITIALADYTARADFTSGLLTGAGKARAEVVLRVAVTEDGRDVLRTIVSGVGVSTVPGGCEAGAEALNLATREAIERASETYVRKIVNSGGLLAARQR